MIPVRGGNNRRGRGGRKLPGDMSSSNTSDMGRGGNRRIKKNQQKHQKKMGLLTSQEESLKNSRPSIAEMPPSKEES